MRKNITNQNKKKQKSLTCKLIQRDDFLCIEVYTESQEKEYVGKIQCILFPKYSEIYIEKVYVKEQYRGRGISKYLFRLLFEAIKNPIYAIYDIVSLNVMPDDCCDINWLIDYYKKLGFESEYIIRNTDIIVSSQNYMVKYLNQN